MNLVNVTIKSTQEIRTFFSMEDADIWMRFHGKSNDVEYIVKSERVNL